MHTPNVQFDIHQIALNPSGKLLAVAGAFQVAVVVLPRTGFSKLVTATVDCKYVDLSLIFVVCTHSYRSFQVGQYHHALDSSAPVAKIDWHPWGQGGSTLLVMTTDGKLRYVLSRRPMILLLSIAASMTYQSMRMNPNRPCRLFLNGV